MGRLRTALLVSAMCATAGCGIVGSPSAQDAQTSVVATTSPTNVPKPQRLGGEDAIGDLSEFDCTAGDNGRWNASGIIINSADLAAGYAITVVVAGAEAPPDAAKQRTLARLPVGAPTQFVIKNVPVSAAVDPNCSVRVVRLP